MKKTIKEVVNSVRLENLKERLRQLERSKAYLEKELPRIREREGSVKKKIGKEKKAITFINRARRLR